MKKENKNAKAPEDSDILPEYDLRGKKGVRNKYAAAMANGYSVHVHNEDGSTTITRYLPSRDAITLDPDVRKYFPDSASVNETLRSLIHLIPKKERPAKMRRGRVRKTVS